MPQHQLIPLLPHLIGSPHLPALITSGFAGKLFGRQRAVVCLLQVIVNFRSGQNRILFAQPHKMPQVPLTVQVAFHMGQRGGTAVVGHEQFSVFFKNRKCKSIRNAGIIESGGIVLIKLIYGGHGRGFPFHRQVKNDAGNIIGRFLGKDIGGVAYDDHIHIIIQQAEDKCPEAGILTGVFEIAMAVQLVYPQAAGIVGRLSGGQHRHAQHLSQCLCFADGGVAVIVHPSHQITGIGLQGGRSVVAVVEDTVEIFSAVIPIGYTPIGNHLPIVFPHHGGGHSQRVKNPLFEKSVEAHTGHPLHDLSQQHEVGVTIAVPGFRLEVQTGLAAQQLSQILLGDGIHITDTAVIHQLQHIPQTTDLVHQRPHPHGFRKRHQIGDILADIVIQRQFSILLQQQNGHSSKLFGDGGYVEYVVMGHGDTVFHIGIAEAAIINHFASVSHQHLSTGTKALLPQVKQRINFLDVIHLKDSFSKIGINLKNLS